MSQVIRLIVGLGNPGLQYQRTRHNAGFLFLDHLHELFGVSAWQVQKQFRSQCAEISVAGLRVMLLKPQTFMNLSGEAVVAAMRFYKLNLDQLLVVHDELDLALGVVKFKKNGGHAGHNGLRDIIAKSGGADFYRLRLGIGRPSHGSVADFVLSAYAMHECECRDAMFACAASKISELVAGKLNIVF